MRREYHVIIIVVMTTTAKVNVPDTDMAADSLRLTTQVGSSGEAALTCRSTSGIQEARLLVVVEVVVVSRR